MCLPERSANQLQTPHCHRLPLAIQEQTTNYFQHPDVEFVSQKIHVNLAHKLIYTNFTDNLLSYVQEFLT